MVGFYGGLNTILREPAPGIRFRWTFPVVAEAYVSWVSYTVWWALAQLGYETCSGKVGVSQDTAGLGTKDKARGWGWEF